VDFEQACGMKYAWEHSHISHGAQGGLISPICLTPAPWFREVLSNVEGSNNHYLTFFLNISKWVQNQCQDQHKQPQQTVHILAILTD
jgi:hypothetical protein